MGFKDMLFKNKEQEKEMKRKLMTPTQSGETTPVILKISRKSKPSTPATPSSTASLE